MDLTGASGNIEKALDYLNSFDLLSKGIKSIEYFETYQQNFRFLLSCQIKTLFISFHIVNFGFFWQKVLRIAQARSIKVTLSELHTIY